MGIAENGAYTLDLTRLQWRGPIAGDAGRETPLPPQPLFFLPDGRLAITSQSSLIYVDVHTQSAARHAIPGAASAVSGYPTFTTSGDGQTVFAGMPTGILNPVNAVPERIPLRAYDVTTGRLRYEVAGIMGVPAACATTNARCASLQRTTPNNLGHQHDPVTVAVFDSITGKLVSAAHFQSWVSVVGFGNYDRALLLRESIFTNVETDFIEIVDPRNGKVQRRFEVTNSGFAFAPAAPLYALTTGDTTTVYTLHGAVVRSIPNIIWGEAGDVTFFPDGSKIAIKHDDGTVSVYATASGKLLATLAFFRQSTALEWLAYTVDGYYCGSPFAISAIRWHAGDQVSAVAAFSEQFYQPNVVKAALH